MANTTSEPAAADAWPTAIGVDVSIPGMNLARLRKASKASPPGKTAAAKRGGPAMPRSFTVARLAVISAITLLYLMIEVPFAAYLVDVVGSNATSETIDRVEHVGRLLSGAAVTLAIWGVVLARADSGKMAMRRAGIWLLAALLAIPAMYVGQRTLVDTIAETSGPELRQRAARAVLAREEFFRPGGGFAGIGAATEDPAWKAFLGLMPFMSHADDRIMERSRGGERALIALQVERLIPDLQEIRRDIHEPLVEEWKERHAAYERMVSDRARAWSSLDQEINDGWNRHMENARRLQIGPGKVNLAPDRNRARRDVQRSGLMVPDNWDPFDRRTFVNVALRDRGQRIESAYEENVRRILASPNGPGPVLRPVARSVDDLMATREAQDTMWARIGIERGGAIRRQMSDAELDAVIRRPLTAETARAVADVYRSSGASFAKGERFDDLGEEAVRAMIVPLMALALSLLGALVHAVKLINNLLPLIPVAGRRFGSTPIRTGFACGLVALACIAAPSNAEPILESGFTRATTASLERGSVVPAIGLIITLHAAMHPLGEALAPMAPFRMTMDALEKRPEAPMRLAGQADFAGLTRID